MWFFNKVDKPRIHYLNKKKTQRSDNKTKPIRIRSPGIKDRISHVFSPCDMNESL